ncbi:putative ribosome biogenesis GTPase RsgA [Paraliobacillus quinghaiensis]|uniref:Small ribosomal subunit biogenesis GTPase RsgA n=1 Tax=Paraliobacillus quinghaiensis TaxID=470815 RepID=A0A917TG16_9BACI|nr:ribosome small subunit-dependent GTPase A [Paraliobacillus quinghaiensis]GGM21022.1 putative ribosome biogenesis GTPase RsgA [Paraliobacillus quinghaiensis]
MPEGKIMKALSGFYYVKCDNGVYQCRGRGLFRKKNITPLVGDVVEFDISNPNEGYIYEVKKRHNQMRRPPIANIDQAIIVVSAKEPDFSALLLDRFLVLVEAKRIEPVIFISKVDMLSEQEEKRIKEIQESYRQIGYQVETSSTKDGSDLQQLIPYFSDNISVIAGQSGVGKSSLLNKLNPLLDIETNEISNSLGRGKHTTRHVELVEIAGGLVADTPGFSSLEFDEIELEELPDCFPEMEARKENCKFRGCMHINEPKCAVKAALENEEITEFRYEHYVQFYHEIKDRKPRY